MFVSLFLSALSVCLHSATKKSQVQQGNDGLAKVISSLLRGKKEVELVDSIETIQKQRAKERKKKGTFRELRRPGRQ